MLSTCAAVSQVLHFLIGRGNQTQSKILLKMSKEVRAVSRIYNEHYFNYVVCLDCALMDAASTLYAPAISSGDSSLRLCRRYGTARFIFADKAYDKVVNEVSSREQSV